MPYVYASPNEYLIVGRGGKSVNYGTAVKVFLWPGTPYVLVSSAQQEATFEMTQESLDGVPLRFKGIIVYRVSDPVVVSRRFNFTHKMNRNVSENNGHAEIKAMLSHVCLGELRDAISHMSMKECIEQRKTTLTDTIRNALVEVVGGTENSDGWGIEIDVAQVAQVFIVDHELRKQLEAELRNQVKSTSELSDIRMREEIQTARASSERKIQQDALETERQRAKFDQEKLQLAKDFERAELEAQIRTSEEVKLAELASERRVQQERLENDRQRFEVEGESMQLKKNLERSAQEAEIRKQEEIKLAELASERRVQQERLENDRQRFEVEGESMQLKKNLERSSQEAEIRKQEEIKLAEATSARRLAQEMLESEKQRVSIADETLQIQKALEKHELEEDAPVQSLRIDQELELIQKRLEMCRIEYEIKSLEVQGQMLAAKAQHEMRREILPMEQAPVIADAISKVFHGANLSVYGESESLVGTIGPLMELLVNTLRQTGVVDLGPQKIASVAKPVEKKR